MNRGWFITGTDTGVGKTRVARGVLAALARDGHTAVGMKPIASGCRETAEGLRSEDAESLRALSGVMVDYALVNPYAFKPAIAPHVAAHAAGVKIQAEKILSCYRELQKRAPWVVVEGVGGWLVPLGDSQSTADIAQALRLPVILVVGLRLGCLNHALLTVAEIQRSGLPLAGWVANEIDPAMTQVAENIETLGKLIPAPMLERFPHVPLGNTPETVCEFTSQTILHLTQIAD